MELTFVVGDDDEGRRQEARTLVETLNARLEDLQQRLDQDDAGQGPFTCGPQKMRTQVGTDEEEEEEFHYPAPVDDAGPSDYFTRPALTATLSTTSSLGRVPDLTQFCLEKASSGREIHRSLCL